MKNGEWRNNVRRPKGKPMKNGEWRIDNSFPGSIAAVYCEYSYAEPTVSGCCTFLVPFFPFVYNVVFLRFQATKLSSEAMIIWNFQPQSAIRTFWSSTQIRGSVEVWRQNGWTIRPEKAKLERKNETWDKTRNAAPAIGTAFLASVYFICQSKKECF